MTNDSKEPFTIQAGKRYNRRDGEIEHIIGAAGVIHYPFIAESGLTYTKDGSYLDLNQPDPSDLISEYIEPTAESQDEWGPWIGWNGGECPVDGASNDTIECIFDIDGSTYKRINEGIFQPVENWLWGLSTIIAYRIKKEPEVRERFVYIGDDGKSVDNFQFMNSRMAIITIQGDNISIRWVNE